MDWKDTTSYSQDRKNKAPSIWDLSINDITICIHKHIHYSKDQWLLTCEPFFNKYELKQLDIEDAKNVAINMVNEKLKKIVKDLNWWQLKD